MRIGTLISGVIATALALAAILVGGGLVLVDKEKDRDGYLSTSSERFETDSQAIATENIDLDLDEAGWFVGAEDFGKVRLRVDAAGDKPVFVGVARTDQVERFLDGSTHTTLTDIDGDPFEATYKDSFGKRELDRPAGAPIWEAKATGTGEQDLVWDVEDGDWSVVVMNADGTPGVSASVSAGAKLPDLATVGWSTMGGGGLVLVLGIVLTVVGARPKKQRAPKTAPLVTA